MVVATSEFWYEDEQEFDAVTELLSPKRLVIVAAEPSTPSREHASSSSSNSAHHENPKGTSPAPELAKALHSLQLDAAFSSADCQSFAQALWSTQPKAGPPYFVKLRVRPALDARAESADVSLKELCGQNWRVVLDYGLPGTTLTASESLLLVCSPAAAGRLLEAVNTASSRLSARLPESGSLSVVAFEGFDGAVRGVPFKSWPDLNPVVELECAWPADVAAMRPT